MSVLLTILIAFLVLGGMLVSRLMGLFTIVDFFRTVAMEKKISDMYEDAKERQRDR